MAEKLAPLAGCASLANLAFIKTLKVEVPDLARNATAEFQALTPYAEITVRARDKEYFVRMLGCDPVIHEVGSLFQDMLLPDLQALEAAVGGWSLLNPLYHRKAERVIDVFLDSEINQKLVSNLGRMSSTVLQELSVLVGNDYIEKAGSALRALLRRSAAWARLRWFAVIVLLAPVSVLLLCWATEFNAPHKMKSSQDALVLLDGNDVLLAAPTAFFFAWGVSWFARRRTVSWMNRLAGGTLWRIGRGERILPNPWVTFLNIVSAVVFALVFVNTNPIWMDQGGRLQGRYEVPGFLTPEIIAPAVESTAQRAVPKQQDTKRKKHKRPAAKPHGTSESTAEALSKADAG